MTRRVIYSPRAVRWLRDQSEYLEQNRPAAVGRMWARLREAEAMLTDFPRIGRPTERPGIRRLTLRPYVLRYREISGGIEIVDIRHQRQAERPLPPEDA